MVLAADLAEVSFRFLIEALLAPATTVILVAAVARDGTT